MNPSLRNAFKSSDHRLVCRAVVFLVTLSLLQTAPRLAGQDEASSGTLSSESLRLRLAQPPPSLDEATQAEWVSLLNNALGDVTQAETNRFNAQRFVSSIDAAPEQTASFQDQLKALGAVDDTQEPAEASQWRTNTVDRLNALAPQMAAELTQRRSSLSSVEEALDRERGRPEVVTTKLAEAKSALRQLAENPTPEEAQTGPLAEALATRREAERLRVTSEIESLEQEALSYDLRLERLKAERELLAAQVERSNLRSAALTSIINQKQQAAAVEAQREADRLLLEAANEDPALLKVAEQVKGRSDELVETRRRIQLAAGMRARLSELQSDLEWNAENTRKQIQLGGKQESVATLILEQRRGLDRVSELEKQLREIQQKLAELRLEGFRLSQAIERRVPITAAVDAALAEFADRDREVQAADEAAMEKALRERLTETYGRLYSIEDELETANETYIKDYSAYVAERSSYLSAVIEFKEFLNQTQIWIPNVPQFGPSSFASLGASLANVGSSTFWSNAVEWLGVVLSSARWMPWTGFALAGFLFFWRPRLKGLSESQAAKVARIRSDRFYFTMLQVLFGLLRVAPPSLIAVSIGLTTLHSANSVVWREALGFGFIGAAAMHLGLAFLAVSLEPKGLAEVHFKWRSKALHELQSHFHWLSRLAAPVTFVVVATNHGSAQPFGSELDRFSMMLGMISLSVFVGLALRPGKGLLAKVTEESGSSWLSRLKPLWFLLMVIAPLSFVFLSLAGYLFAAYELALLLSLTLATLLVAVLMYEVLTRWFTIRERRIALEQALEKRREQQELAKAAAEGGQPPVAQEIDESTIDIESFRGQTRRLVRTLIGFAFAWALWWEWHEVLPALNALESFQLGNSDVTAFDIVVGLVIALFTILAAGNLPGALETGLLQNLPIEAGTRYAVVTLSQYAVFAIGFIIASQALHVSWEQLGWILAALSLGLGFGLQEIISNFICGMILLFERPIRVGDIVTVSDVTGVVSRIRIRATTVTNWDRQEFLVPNKEFVTGRVLNWTLSNTVNRIVILVGVSYDCDVERATQTLLRIADEDPYLLKDPAPSVTFDGFGDNALNLTMRAYLPSLENRLTTTHALHRAIHEGFREAGIEIPYPQRDIHIRSMDPKIPATLAGKTPRESKAKRQR